MRTANIVISTHLIVESLCKMMLSFSRVLTSTALLSLSSAVQAANHSSLLHTPMKWGNTARGQELGKAQRWEGEEGRGRGRWEGRQTDATCATADNQFNNFMLLV